MKDVQNISKDNQKEITLRVTYNEDEQAPEFEDLLKSAVKNTILNKKTYFFIKNNVHYN